MMRDQPKRSITNTSNADDNEKPAYKCPYCSKEFTDHSWWTLHKQLHTSTEVYRCQQCTYTCRIKKYLARHMKFHRPPTEYKCEVCGKGFHFRCKLDNHMRVHTKEKPFACSVCEKAFSSSYSLSGHMLTHTDEKPFQCSYCKYACRDSSTLRKHEERHIGASRVYECQICNKSYKCKWQLKAHLEEKHFGLEAKRYPCHMCDKMFKSKYNVDKHIKAVHEKSLTCECEVCGHVISNRANLAQHMKRHVDVKPYRCTFANCGRRFKEKGDLRKHVIIHYPEKQHPCGICGRLFARRWRLARHMAGHTTAVRSRAVECHHCGVLFYSKNYLLRHISRKHDRKRKKFICDLCDFTTSNKPSLVMHLKYGHSGRRDRKCQICEKVYKKPECLKMHYLKTHNIRFKTLLKGTQEDSPIEVKEELGEEECVEYHPEIDLLEIHKEELVEPEYSDPITYSETVLTEDISRSVMQRDERMLGEPENEFDSFFIDHVMEKPDNSVEKSDKYNVDEPVINSRKNSVEIDVEKLDEFDADGLRLSRELSVEIDVEKFDKFDENLEKSTINSFEKSDSSMEDLGEYCVERPAQDIYEENLKKNSVKSVKVFVEKLDKSIIEKAVKNNVVISSKLTKNTMENNEGKLDKSLEKSVKITVEKLDINSLRKKRVENISVLNLKKYNLKNNNSLKVCVEKLDVNRLMKLRMLNAGKKRKKTRGESDKSYVVKINKSNLGRRDNLKRRRKRGVKTVENSDKNAKKSVDATPEADATDYSKSVLSEDISRCLQERAGRHPGEPENTLEGIFIDHYMEKSDDSPQSEEDSSMLEYSRRVVAEDVSRSIARRDRRAAGDPQADIDRIYIDHLMEKPDNKGVELVKKNIDTQKERYVKKCVDKMLQQLKAQKQAAILEETRQQYNDRINELSNKANRKKHVNIKYFQNKSSEEENNVTKTIDDENGDLVGDQTAENNNIDAKDGNDDQTAENNNIDTRDGDDGILLDDQIADSDDIDIRDDENDDDEQIPIDEGIVKKNNKITFNTHQCYICFKLFKTKSDLTHHCKDHFQVCNYKMLKKCPFCGYVTNLQLKRHLRLKHDVKLEKMFNTKMTEIPNENGSKYVLETEQCTLEVIPSINNLNRKAYIKIDETNRFNKNNQISSSKLIKKGAEWVVDKDIMIISKDYQLPQFTMEEYMSLKIPGDKYEDMLKKLSYLAKKRGVKMLFPCNECDKVCRKMSGLVLHFRVHEDNPKPFKAKKWKARTVKTKNINKNIQSNGVQVITSVRNSISYKEFTENRNKRKRAKNIPTSVTDNGGNNDDITNNVDKDNNISLIGRKLPENRFAEPKPIENKHKCEKELMEFYKNNIKCGDIEFWQFLKIFNKMSRENVNDFEDLESRSDFGIHNIDSTAVGNTESQIYKTVDATSTDTLEDGNTASNEIDDYSGMMKMKNGYKRVIMINKRDIQRRNEIKNELRKRIESQNEIG